MEPGQRGIGLNGQLPWHLPEDLKVFKQLTMGHPILMGRKTYESIGRPLPGRQSIVLTRDKNWSAPDGVIVIHHIDELSSLSLIDPEIMVIGGAEIFLHMLPVMSKIYISLLHNPYPADTFLPELEANFPHKRLVESFTDFDLMLFSK